MQHIRAGLVLLRTRNGIGTDTVVAHGGPLRVSATDTVVVEPERAEAAGPVEFRRNERDEMPVGIYADIVRQRRVDGDRLRQLALPALGAVLGLEKGCLAQRTF
jgi:hypothetical protein